MSVGLPDLSQTREDVPKRTKQKEMKEILFKRYDPAVAAGSGVADPESPVFEQETVRGYLDALKSNSASKGVGRAYEKMWDA